SDTVHTSYSQSLFVHRSHPLRPLHSFPTRRSSDLTSLTPRMRTVGGKRLFSALRIFATGMGQLVLKFATWPAAWTPASVRPEPRSEEHTSDLQSRFDLVYRLLLEKKKKEMITTSRC